MTAAEYEALRDYLTRPPARRLAVDQRSILKPPPLWGVPWSAPVLAGIADRLALFEPLVALRMVWEAIEPLLSHDDLAACGGALEWFRSALADPQRFHAEYPEGPVVSMNSVGEHTDVALTTIFALLPSATRPGGIPGHPANDREAFLAKLQLAVLSGAMQEHLHRIREQPDDLPEHIEFDSFLTRWWGRCMARLPVRDIMTARIEWSTDTIPTPFADQRFLV